MIEIVSVNMVESMAKIMVGVTVVSIVSVSEVRLFVKAVLDVVAVISEASVLSVSVVTLVSEVVAKAMVSKEERVRLSLLSKLLDILKFSTISGLILMWAHWSVSFWENTLVGVAIVVVFSTSVVPLVGGFDMVGSGVEVVGWVSSVVGICVAELMMRGSVVWGGMDIVVRIMSPEVLVVWCSAMMSIGEPVETTVVWGSVSVSEESVAGFFSGGSGCDNC